MFLKCQDGELKLNRVWRNNQWVFEIDLHGSFPKVKILKIISIFEKEIV
jgi:hypothetical protein